MKSAVFVALFALGCGKSAHKAETGSGSGSGTPVAVTHDAGSAAATAQSEEPTDPPPPPIVKPGGKGDCKTEYAPKPTRDPNPMCKVDGGTFTMGDDNERMAAKVSPYYIDQFEVTAAQVSHFLNATHGKYACSRYKGYDQPCFYVPDTEVHPSNKDYVEKQGDKYGAVGGYEQWPFAKATRPAAAAYCAWAGKKLPTEAQWEFAARHDPATKKDLVYPWGDKFEPLRARCDHKLCGSAENSVPLQVATFDGTEGHRDGRSPWGAFDMAGNVAEFVLGCLNDYHPCKDGPCVDPPGEPARKNEPCDYIERGGDYRAFQPERLTTSNRAQSPGEAGFRCVR